MVPVLRPVVNQHESSSGQVIAVVQPHRYTRLSSLFDQFSTCFNDADTVIVAHVYPAGETPIPGADRDSLVQGLRAHPARRRARPRAHGQAAGAARRHRRVSAPATSRNGPTHCPESLRRSARWRSHLPTSRASGVPDIFS
jgi:Mur ligase family, glutamate ligase domain